VQFYCCGFAPAVASLLVQSHLLPLPDCRVRGVGSDVGSCVREQPLVPLNGLADVVVGLLVPVKEGCYGGEGTVLGGGTRAGQLEEEQDRGDTENGDRGGVRGVKLLEDGGEGRKNLGGGREGGRLRWVVWLGLVCASVTIIIEVRRMPISKLYALSIIIALNLSISLFKLMNGIHRRDLRLTYL